MTTKYYRAYSENLDGHIGHCYYEVINQSVVRMINVFNDKFYWSMPTECKDKQHEFTDQPEFYDRDIPWLVANLELIELTAEEFESMWKKAHQ